MDFNRAEEIIQSLGVINVTYKNNAIWIEDIQRPTNTAHIKDLKTSEIKEVPINQLKEE
ncbi:MAG: Small acid-soluble spore protein family [Clostridiaceae bacterium]|jgi:small acid-soluble spore protein H (minor)|nr:Small acid-soluble spore protein family [Clostridiaceae bacterium]